MSTEAKGHHDDEYGWITGIPPLDPIDPRHSVSLIMIAEARSGYAASKRIVERSYAKSREKAKYNIVWDDTGESMLATMERLE